MGEQLKIYASLAMLLLFSTWFVFSIDPEDVQKVSVSENAPDYYMDTFVTTSFTEAGKVKQRLSAKRLEHYPTDNRSEFSSVLISTTNPDKSIWEITADRGFAFGSGKKINLRGDINISEVTDKHSMKVSTEALQIDYGKNIASTKLKVAITDDYGTITGEGMLVDLKNKVLTLQSRVRGHYSTAKVKSGDTQ